MKKLMLVMLLFVVAMSVPCFADTVAKVAESAKAPVPFMEQWGAIIGQIALIFISIVGAAISAFLLLIAKLVARKFGFEIDEKEEAYIEGKLQIGIGASEAWARSLKNKPTSHEKMMKALEVADSAMGKTKIKKYTQNKLMYLVESLLDNDATKKKGSKTLNSQ